MLHLSPQLNLDKRSRMGEGKHARSVTFDHTLGMCEAEHLIKVAAGHKTYIV